MSTCSSVENSDCSRKPRRRRREGNVRRRQVVVRFSDEEWSQVTGRAELANLAVGAWIGHIAVEVAAGHLASHGLPDLLRLHGDVLRMQSLAPRDELGALLRRLDAAVDAVVAEIERGQQ